MKFHGSSPKGINNGAKINNFYPLKVQVCIIGGYKMEYRIKKLPKFDIVCKKQLINKSNDITDDHDIFNLWTDFDKNYDIQKLYVYCPVNSIFDGVFGITFSNKLQSSTLPYAIGVEYNEEKFDDSFEVITIPAHTYAVFECKGALPNAFLETYNKIFSKFFPQNNRFEYASGLEIEVYKGNIHDPNYSYEIWIEVKET